jgi:hypothetical protein
MIMPESPLAKALRDKGFVPLKRLWVHRDALPEIETITERYRADVNAVRGELGYEPEADPRHSKDAAWEAFERDRSR